MSVMHVATLDILTDKGGFNPEAARAIGEAIDLEIARSRDTSASREDVGECRRTLAEDIALLRCATDGNLSGLRSKIEVLCAELKVEMHSVKADVVRWVFVAIMGQTAMLLGVLYFFMKPVN